MPKTNQTSSHESGGDADRLSYHTNAPGDWIAPEPRTVQQGLDDLAARPIGIDIDYFFNDTGSGIGGIYFDMTDTDLSGAESTLTTAGLGSGDDQPLLNFASPSGFPGIETLRSGLYDVHFHAERTSGNRSVNIYAEIYTRTAGGTETLRMTTELSGAVDGKADYTLHASLAANVDINATDRLVIKFFANVGATGADVDVALYAEGSTDSHFTFPTTSDVLSNVFVRQDGTKELTADWDAGSHKITAETLESDVATGTAPLVVASTTVVTNLNADKVDGSHAADFISKSLLDQEGDLIIAEGTALPGRLAVGSANTRLGSDGTVPFWVDPSSQVKWQYVFYLENPAASDEFPIGPNFAAAATIKKVWGETDAGTVDFNIEERPASSAFSSGTDVTATEIVAATTQEVRTSFNNIGIVANASYWVTISAIASSPGKLLITIQGTFN